MEVSSTDLRVQTRHRVATPLALWNVGAPGALGKDPVMDIPTLTPYWPAQGTKTGAAMIVCPGGGYWELTDYEGKDYAHWLNERGIAAFVLKYRLASNGYHHSEITADIFRAIRTVRAYATSWGLNPARVGVIGSSAGGHLVSVAMTHFNSGDPDAEDPVERVSSRPDLGALCYAVVSMESFAEPGTRENFLGKDTSVELVRHYSSELHVRTDTPPCFLWHTQDDRVVPIEHALLFAAELHRSGVPLAVHLFPYGEHGLGLGVHGYTDGFSRTLHPWTLAFAHWLRSQKFII